MKTIQIIEENIKLNFIFQFWNIFVINLGIINQRGYMTICLQNNSKKLFSFDLRGLFLSNPTTYPPSRRRHSRRRTRGYLDNLESETMQIAYMTYTVQHFPFQLFKQESICFLLVFLEGLKCKHEDSNPSFSNLSSKSGHKQG